MGSSNKESVVQKQTNEPWSGIQPNLSQIGSEAQRLYQNGTGPSYYPGSTYIPPTAQEMAGLQSQQNTATQGSPLTQNLLRTTGDLAGIMPGQGNPTLMGLLDTSAHKATDSINGMFSGSGRYGSTANQNAVGETVGNIYTSGLTNQYNQDIANKLSLSAQAPQLDAMRYGDAQKLIDIGAAQRGELQSENQSNIDRHNAQQSRPWDQLSLYNNIIGGLGGGSGTQTTYGQQGSPLYSILGGAATGAGIAGQLGLGGLLGGGTTALGGLLGGFA